MRVVFTYRAAEGTEFEVLKASARETAIAFWICVVYRTIILPVLYGCETWSLTLREERRLRLFECRVLRRIFGPKRDEVTGEWRRLHNEEVHDMYSSPTVVRVIKLRRMRWVGHVARMGEGRGVHRVLVRKSEGKRPLGSPRHRRKDNFKIEYSGSGMRWYGLV
jgi:hypothetical protein